MFAKSTEANSTEAKSTEAKLVRDAGNTVRRLAAPITLTSDQIKQIAAGTVPGVKGPLTTSGMIPVER
jgi:hypothetical protein